MTAFWFGLFWYIYLCLSCFTFHFLSLSVFSPFSDCPIRYTWLVKVFPPLYLSPRLTLSVSLSVLFLLSPELLVYISFWFCPSLFLTRSLFFACLSGLPYVSILHLNGTKQEVFAFGLWSTIKYQIGPPRERQSWLTDFSDMTHKSWFSNRCTKLTLHDPCIHCSPNLRHISMLLEVAAGCERVLINHFRAHILDKRQLPSPLVRPLTRRFEWRLFVKANNSWKHAEVWSDTAAGGNCSTWLCMPRASGTSHFLIWLAHTWRIDLSPDKHSGSHPWLSYQLYFSFALARGALQTAEHQQNSSCKYKLFKL